jgi:flagellar hook-basal body complex protein FliE
MAIPPIVLKTYADVAEIGNSGRRALSGQQGASFTEQLQESLAKVNDLQQQKNAMISSFAAGENQNVHELMISLQKAGMAMSLTSAVRNKVLEAYRELMKMPF